MKSGDLEERTQRQLERLQSTLNRAFRSVPFHQHRLRRNGIHPTAIESAAHLAELPFITPPHPGENHRHRIGG